jgi:two-component system, LytTR family, response regulator
MADESTDRVRTLIVDGEDLGRRMLRSLLAADCDIEIVDEARSVTEARRKISELKPDLVLLDPGIPDGSGVDLLQALEPRPYVIVLSAHAEYALQAFELQADDFLVKPVLRQRFTKSVIHARRCIAERLVAGLARRIALATDAFHRGSAALAAVRPAGYPNHMMIRVRRRVHSVDVGEISWIEGASQYSRVHTRDGEFLLSRTLGSLECELDPERFLRLHRSAIVNAAYVTELRSSGDGRYYVHLRCGKVLCVGRTRRAALEMLAAGIAGRSVKKSGGPEGPPRVVLQGAI